MYNLDPELTADELSNYLRSKKIDTVECELLKSKYPDRYSSFKVSFPSKYFEEVNRPEFWPENTCVNRFLFHLSRKQQEK